jgi:tetratricopeptide (TPR) repeat protein
VLRELGQAEEGESLAREAVRISVAARGPDAPETAAHRSHLGLCLVALKRYDQAEEEMLEAWRVLEPRLASGDPRAISAATNLRRLYLQSGREVDAERFASVLATTRPAPTRPLPPATVPSASASRDSRP